MERPKTDPQNGDLGTKKFDQQRLLMMTALIAGGACLLMALLGEHGLLRSLQYRKEKQILSTELRRIEAQNRQLRQEIDVLRNDGKYVETIARRELGMVRSDEIIYQFPASGEKASQVRRLQTGQ